MKQPTSEHHSALTTARDNARNLELEISGLLGIAARNAGGPEPRVPGPAGGAVLLQARLALAALGRGRALAALEAKAPGGALRGAPAMAGAVGGPLLRGAWLAPGAPGFRRPVATLQAEILRAPLSGLAVVAFQIARPPGQDIGIDHRRVLPAGVGIGAGDARPSVGRRDVPGRPLTPSACGRTGGPSRPTPNIGSRCRGC